MLGPGGYEVLTAVDGADGLRLVLQERPDLVILDAQAPGVGGVEFLQALKEQGSAVPIILCAARGSEDLLVQALRLGVRDCVVKPFEPQEMRLAVGRVLAQARLEAERDQLTAQLGEVNERLQRQLQELQTLYGLGRSVTSFLDLDTVLERVVEAAVLVTQAEEGLLLLRELPEGDLLLRAARDLDEESARPLRVPIDDTLAGQVVRTGEQVVIAQARSKLATGYLVNALIYVPLRTAEAGIIGVLGVANRRSDRSFSEHEVQVLSALADYASVAVQNAGLYERAETERRKLEAVLRETAEGVVVFDFSTGIELANPTAREALQLPSDETTEATEIGELHPSVRELLDAVARSGRVTRTEVPIGDGRTFSAQVSPVEGVGYVLMMQDVTHLKELDRVKSEFVATVSHDLRTPLTTIQGYVALLERVGPLSHEQQEFVKRVQTSIADVSELTGELLDLGRIETGYDLAMEPVQLGEIIDEAVEVYRPRAQERGQELRWESRALPAVLGSRHRLGQVMEHLLSNALKYTPDGGWIAVEAMGDGEYVIVRVADNGVGIPVADQPYVFERFYRVESEVTSDVGGTGLGLTIVRSVIEKHGGRVWVESQPGTGSVFTFVLPRMRRADLAGKQGGGDPD